MKTFQVDINILDGDHINTTTHFVSTDADKLSFQKAIDFVGQSPVKDIQGVLTAVRLFGFKAREVKVQAEEVFDL